NIFAAARNPLSPNSFVTITSNLTSILLLPITIRFDLFIKPLLVGCLVLVALVLFAIFLIFALFIIPNPQTTGSPKDGSIIPPSELVVSGTCPLLESPVISCGSLGSGGNSCEHGGVGYGNVCYGVPIRGMWVWDDQPANDPNRLRCADKDGNLQEPGYCNGTSCPYFGYATDVESSTPNPTIRLPYICSETQNSSTCGPMTWTVVDTFYNCRGGSTNTKEECEAKEFVDNNGNLLPKENQLWGWGTIFESDDNGHHWKLYLNHYENTVPVGRGSTFTADSQQSSTIGIIPEGAYVDHLHYELVVDGTPVRPDYLCQ
ncbi:MAG: hypothetical protein HYS86_03795, partial [Candidatus Chisholmbacteria bacterium]|nr:hypothetical protein [Candidatus Chisholmbacteria bacterium]